MEIITGKNIQDIRGASFPDWADSFGEELHGIVTDPRGDDGFLLRDKAGWSWFRLGEGQNPHELCRIIGEIQSVDLSPDLSPTTTRLGYGYLQYLGSEARELSQPKK